MTTPMTIDRSLVTSTIRTLIAENVASGQVADARAIGDGFCYQFAKDVMERLGVGDDFGNYRGLLQDVQTQDFCNERDDGELIADLRLLRHAGETVPLGIPPRTFKKIFQEATHAWLKFDDRYYDASDPDGRDRFLDLPFFADQFAGWRAEQAEKAEAKAAFAP